MTYKKFYKDWWYWYNDSDGRYHLLPPGGEYFDINVKSDEDALALSIEKWEVVKNFYEKFDDHILLDGGADTCALCRFSKFFCKACIIYKETGENCGGLPYEDYYEAVCTEDREAAVEAGQGMLDVLLKVKEEKNV